jgi:hypothetical protein
MTHTLFRDALDALTYGVHASAVARDIAASAAFRSIRADLVAAFPGHAASYVPAADR